MFNQQFLDNNGNAFYQDMDFLAKLSFLANIFQVMSYMNTEKILNIEEIQSATQGITNQQTNELIQQFKEQNNILFEQNKVLEQQNKMLIEILNETKKNKLDKK